MKLERCILYWSTASEFQLDSAKSLRSCSAQRDISRGSVSEVLRFHTSQQLTTKVKGQETKPTAIETQSHDEESSSTGSVRGLIL